jgi:hypothetical protein
LRNVCDQKAISSVDPGWLVAREKGEWLTSPGVATFEYESELRWLHQLNSKNLFEIAAGPKMPSPQKASSSSAAAATEKTFQSLLYELCTNRSWGVEYIDLLEGKRANPAHLMSLKGEAQRSHPLFKTKRCPQHVGISSPDRFSELCLPAMLVTFMILSPFKLFGHNRHSHRPAQKLHDTHKAIEHGYGHK